MNRAALSQRIAVLLLFCGAATAGATTRTVTSLGDSGAGTLRSVIAVAGDGDIINFSVIGKINLTSGSLTITRNITVSGPGAAQLEVTRASGTFGVFVIDQASTVTISGLAITNGQGILDHSSVTFYGGGITILSGSVLTVNSCSFSGNTSDLDGGAILANGSLTVTGSTFSNNSAVEGSGIYGNYSSVIVSTSTFTGNIGHNDDSINAKSNGGAITVFGNSSLSVSNCVFTQNSAYLGGAIFDYGFGGTSLTTTVSDSTFTSNSSSTNGGAIAGNFATLAVRNCTLAGNTATNFGGAIYGNDGASTIRNCTLANNTAQTGGGLYNLGSGNNQTGTANVSSCTFSRNAAPNGGGIYNTGTQSGNAFVVLSNTILYSTNADPGANLINDGSGTSITSQGYNLSSDNGGGFLTATGDQINTDPKLDTLKDNGGPTMTMTLLAGSPAQDKGKRFGVGTDQRGLTRPVDITGIPNANGGDGSDIGSVEMTSIIPFLVTTTADHDDGNCNASDCTLREAINAANNASGSDTILFAANVTGTIILQSALGTLLVNGSVDIIGPGPRVLAVSGDEAIRVLTFNAGTSSITGLTIRDGWLAGFSGNGVSRFGGGILNHSNLTVSQCAFTNNFVSGANNLSNGAKGGDGMGGAIYNDGTLTLTQSSFGAIGSPFNPNTVGGGGGAQNTNQIGSGGAGGVGQGGAVYNSGTVTVTDCTFKGNGAVGGGGGPNTNFAGGTGGDGSGGAIFNTGTLSMTGCTISGNQAVGGAGGQGQNKFNNGLPGMGGGGGLKNSTAEVLVRNSIIAGNSGNNSGGMDVDGAFDSGGYNLIGTADHSTGFTASADQTGKDAALLNPKLGSLQNNSGPTDTMALLSGSTAINAGNAFGLTLDQRGFPRTVDVAFVSGGDGTDIGAYETQTVPPSPTPTPTASPTATPGSLGNVSTRLQVGTGDNVLFAGFIIQGSASKTVLIRSAGPSLTSIGLPGALPNPQLELHDGNNTIGTNDNWQTTQLGGVITSDQVAAIQNSGAAPLDPAEPAIIATLPAGGYTAIVQGVGGTEGIATVEVYDLSPNNGATLANISTRGFIQTGDNVMIGGFIVVGQSLSVLIRATGPSLIPFGINNALANPQLELHDANGTLAANDDWQTTQLGGIITSDQSTAIQNSGLAPGNPAESAIIATLPPGGYTAIAQGVNGGTGVGLIEVFALP